MPDARILIVEDEAIEAMDIQQSLTGLGYPLPDIAHNGEEGVRKAKETQPDLVLMDIMMPGEIDGIAAAEQILSHFDIPIVFLTAYADEDTLRRAKITAPYGYIIKPFQERELHITVDMALYRHKMERKLREKKKWLAITLRSIGDGVIITDEKGLITFTNPVAEELMGYKLEEVLQKNLTEVFNIVNRDTHKPAENPVTRVMLEGNIVGLANHTVLISKNGREIHINDSAAPIKDERGNIRGIILVFSDITEREEAQEAIRKANIQLEAANREKDAFNYTVSHDLRAPLRTIASFVKILAEDYAERLDAQGRDYLNRIYASSEKMDKLIENLLYLSRVSRQEVAHVDFNISKKASSIVSNLSAADPGRNVEVSIEEGLAVFADPGLTEIILTNLLSNAWKFTAKTQNAWIEFGAFKCGTDQPRIADCATIPDSEAGKTVYYVRDNGAGFDSDYKEKLFRPFQRLHSDKEFEGIGIGLTIVEQLIRRHGGKVWAEGQTGEGATFYFTVN